jgi:F-type H+-transporting ATPase subunit delta
MIGGSLSRRYAKALFQLALEEHKEEAIGEEIERFVAANKDSPLMKVLNNPAFPVRNRKNILLQVAQGLGLSPTVVHFLSLLLERGRLTFFHSMAAYYRYLLDERKGRVEARVVVAKPLDDAVLERLREALRRLSAKEVVLHSETNPVLIGGLMVHMEGRIYDGSVRTQLEKMKRRIERGY